jgi:hypothetical protein
LEQLPPDAWERQAMMRGVATAMRDFMKFHAAKELVIEKSQPSDNAFSLWRAVGAEGGDLIYPHPQIYPSTQPSDNAFSIRRIVGAEGWD